MSQPAQHNSTADGLSLPDAWAGTLPLHEMWADGLSALDEVPAFDAEADPEVDTTAHLKEDLAFTRTASRRIFKDYRSNPEAFRHLEKLPAAGQTLHGVISGRYALFDLLPAMLERTKENIAELHIATLSYGKQNAAELLELVDSGRIKRVSLLVSYYFKSTSRPLYDSLVPPLLERGHRVLSMRTHCKIMLMKFGRGTRYVVESSANLRSCKNIEQFALTRCPKLYRFHRDWMEDELFKPREKERADAN